MSVSVEYRRLKDRERQARRLSKLSPEERRSMWLRHQKARRARQKAEKAETAALAEAMRDIPPPPPTDDEINVALAALDAPDSPAPDVDLDDILADELDAIRRGKSPNNPPTDDFGASAEKDRLQADVNATLAGLGL